jgi:hypothetical protein
MNAKFEKWCEDEGLVGRSKSHAKAGYIYAIQSLEVTPELISVAWRAMDDAHNTDQDSMSLVLKEVVSALKEQAK